MSNIAKQLNDNLSILRRPRVTEKSTAGASAADRGGRPCYTFEVALTANKFTIKRAILERYKVTPIKININVVKSKKFFSRGRTGARGGFKKAIVYLKSGDKIEL